MQWTVRNLAARPLLLRGPACFLVLAGALIVVLGGTLHDFVHHDGLEDGESGPESCFVCKLLSGSSGLVSATVLGDPLHSQRAEFRDPETRAPSHDGPRDPSPRAPPAPAGSLL